MKLHYDISKEIARRKRLYDRCDSDMGYRSVVYEMCRRDPLVFIRDWCWSVEPREIEGTNKRKILPFVPFPKQSDYIRWIHERYQTQTPGVVIKPRGVGASWLNVFYSVWHLTFVPSSKISMSAQIASNVDKLGSMDSLLEKCRFVLGRLPHWMRPETYSRYMYLGNKSTGSTIEGFAGIKSARGGRSTLFIADEFADVGDQMKLEASISENTNCPIYVSTYQTNDDLFYAKATNEHIKKFEFSWRDDLRRDQDWYDQKLLTTDPHIMATEVDCNPNPPANDRVFSGYDVTSIVDSFPNEGIEIGIGIDHGELTGRQAISVIVYSSALKQIYIVADHLSTKATTPSEDADQIKTLLARFGWTINQVGMIFGDVNTAGKVLPGKSVNDLIAEKLGVKLSKPDKSPGSVEKQSRHMNEWLMQSQIKVMRDCKHTDAAFLRWGGSDDKYKHIVDSLRYIITAVIKTIEKPNANTPVAISMPSRSLWGR